MRTLLLLADQAAGMRSMTSLLSLDPLVPLDPLSCQRVWHSSASTSQVRKLREPDYFTYLETEFTHALPHNYFS